MILWLLALAVLAVLLYTVWWKRKNLPPGPIPLPIVGNSLQLMSYQSTDEALNAWKKRYGEVFTFWTGSRPIVCLANFSAVYKYFVQLGDKFVDRADGDFSAFAFDGVYGLLQVNGEAWKSQRRFALEALQAVDFDEGAVEKQILAEINDLLEHMNKQVQSGQPSYQLTRHVDQAVGSVINSLLLGYRYNDDNLEEFEDLKRRVQIFMKTTGSPEMFAVRDHLAFFDKVPVLGEPVRLAKEQALHLRHFFEDHIRNRVQQLDNAKLLETTPTDMVDCFLKERAKAIAEKGDEQFFTMPQLAAFCVDMWTAGQDTISSTLGFGLAYLIHNPKVQEKAQKELSTVIGSDRVVKVADKNDLPYTQAVCCEIQRLCNLMPLSVARRTTEDVQVEGYHLPKGTAITPALGCLLYDEKVFPEPHSFKPERFLDEHGNFKHVDQHIPFGIGKRRCLGEQLALKEIFLFVANLLNHFELRADGSLPDLSRGHGVTMHIRDYSCRLVPRVAQ